MNDNESKYKTFSRRRISIVLLAVTVVIMLSFFSRIENWKRDLTTNYAKLDPQSVDEHLRPLSLNESPQAVAERLERWAGQQSAWSVESSESTDSDINIKLTRTTAWMRFTDDIRVRLVADGDGTRVEAESQSRVGKGDLGQNPKNLRELVSGLTEDR